MKKISILLLILIIVSCQKSVFYSENETINEWVEQNKSKFNSINRESLLKFNLSEQKAIYRSLISQNRKNLWIQKVDFVKSKMNNKDEIAYVNELKSIINSINFSQKLELNDVQILEVWIRNGIEKFNWNEYFIYSSFKLLSDVTSSKTSFDKLLLNENFKSTTYRGVASTNMSSSCDSNWCADCNLIGGTCKGGCSETTIGCGLFWLQTCNKNCVPSTE